jgi:hypothetical protein
MAVKNSWLPQITSDYDYVYKNLDTSNVGYKIDAYDPHKIKPLTDNVNIDNIRGIKDSVLKGEPVNPIFISKDDEVLDGHDRLFAFQMTPEVSKIICVKVYADKHDASRILNKIQDKYNWENNLDDNFQEKANDLEESEGEPKNKKTLTLYSNKPFVPNTKVGNLLIDKQKPSFDKAYQFVFENLYELDDKECGDNPIESLSKKWFPDYDNFKMEAARAVLTFENYVLKRIYQEAYKRGFDGIKYGTKFVQTID